MAKKKNHNNDHTKHVWNYVWIYPNLKLIMSNIWNDKNTFGISKRSHLVKPFQTIVINQNMGNIMEKTTWLNKWMGDTAMGEYEDWQKKSYIIRTNYKHFEGGYGRLPLGNVCTCHGFLPRMAKFGKVNFRTFLYKLIERFVNEGFGNPGEPPINRIYGTK